MGSCPGITAGEDFLQIGDWRLAQSSAATYHQFRVTHRLGQMAVMYDAGGLVHVGPLADPDSWYLEAKEATSKVLFGDRFIQIGQWRLGEVDADHFSLSHSSGAVGQIWHASGTRHPTVNTYWDLWTGSNYRPVGPPTGITFGDRFVQIGGFRIGDVDGRHFSVAHKDGTTIEIFREDGLCFGGPRNDYTTFGRSLRECWVV